jgi:putative heme-binding domain-containing protein
MGRPADDVAADVAKDVSPLFPAKTWPMNRELSQLLIYLRAPGIVKQVLDLRDAAATQEEQLHYMVALRMAPDWSLEERRRYLAWFQKRPPTGDNGQPLAVRNTGHTRETLQWFRDVGRDFSDGASYNNFLKKLRAAVSDKLSPDEKTQLASLLTDAPSATAAKPKRTYKIEREWKTADLAADLDRVGQGRSFDSGREAYAAAKCLDCHRFGNEGGAIGPDLTAISSRFSRRDLVESILEPSKVVSEQYMNLTVVKKDGDDVTGRLVEETDTQLVLVPNQLTGEKVTVKKGDIASRAPSKLSPMPEGLVNVLTRDDLLDLLAYLESGGKKDHANFRAR